MKPARFAPLLLTAAAAFALPALAQQQHQHHGAPAAAAGTPAVSPSTAAYEAANNRMHEAMSIRFTGDADRDFLAGMIGHHQGAIEMAQVVLKYGKDPKVRKLAQDIIAAQNAEIAQMREWLNAYDSKR